MDRQIDETMDRQTDRKDNEHTGILHRDTQRDVHNETYRRASEFSSSFITPNPTFTAVGAEVSMVGFSQLITSL